VTALPSPGPVPPAPRRTTPPPAVTGNPTIDQWIAEGRLAPQPVPGTVLDLLPLPEPADDGFSLSEAVIAERDREPE
jgi:hypothetical protein